MYIDQGESGKKCNVRSTKKCMRNVCAYGAPKRIEMRVTRGAPSRIVNSRDKIAVCNVSHVQDSGKRFGLNLH